MTKQQQDLTTQQNHQPATAEADNATSRPASKAKSKKSWCRLLLCGGSAVIFGFIFLLLVLLATDRGQLALIRLADKMLDSLTIEQVSGSLGQGLVLENMHYQTDGVEVSIAQTRLQLDLGCLWQRKICLQDFSLTQPTINIDTALLAPAQQQNASSAPMQRVNLPISVQADKLALNQLAIKLDEQQINLATFESALSLNNEEGLTLAPTRIDGLQFLQQTAPVTELDLADDSHQNASAPLDWQELEQRLQQPLLGNLKEIQLPFDLHIKQIEGTNWLYQQRDSEKLLQQITIPLIQLQAEARDYLVQLQKLHIESSLGELNGEGSIQLNQDFALELHVTSRINKLTTPQQLLLEESQLSLQLSGALLKQTQLSLTSKGGINSQLSAKVELNQPKTPFSLEFTSPAFRYPATGNDPFISKEVQLVAEGDLFDYQLKVNGQAQGMGAPQATLDLALTGGLSQAQLQQLVLKTLGGQAELTGELAWQQGLSWQQQLTLNQINTANFLPEWRALLSGELQTKGYVNSDNWHIELPTLALQGRLNGHSLALQGELVADKSQLLDVRQLSLNYGNNQLQAQGKLSQESDFNLQLDAPNLTGLLPDLSANLQGNVKIKGNIAEPEVAINLQGKNIHFQQMNLADISLNSQISSEQQIQGLVNLNLAGFNFDQVALKSLQLSLAGNEQQHQLQLRSTGQPVALNLDLTGQFKRNEQQWQGALAQVEIDTPIGAIRNNQNIEIDYQNLDLTATLSAHCWHNPKLELCFPTALTLGKEGAVQFALNKLDLTALNQLIQQEDLLQGQLTSQGQVNWFAEQPLALNLELDGKNLRVKQPINYRDVNLAISNLHLASSLQQNNLDLSASLNLADNGGLNSHIQLKDIAQARQLTGSLQLNQLDLTLLEQLLAKGEKIGGELNANLQFGGNLQAPLLNGDIRLEQLAVSLFSSPVPITNGQLRLQFNGNSSQLSGLLESQENRLELSGKANWQDLNRWTAEVAAKAQEFAVDIPGMARLRLSPDIQLSASPSLLNLSGEVNIPWARIQVEQLPESAVTVSSDEVILDQLPTGQISVPKRQTAQTGMLIQSDLRINIGDDVRLEAYGLKTELKGLLSVRQDKGNLGLYGQIDLIKGRYSSFGQDLLIRKGQISFSGLPSQPLLNIEAIRNPEVMEDSTVVAGVKVVGLADAPEATIFAEPSMSQDQALSYLLTGRSLENSGETGSSSSVGVALLGLGLAQSGKVLGGIGETFGIQDLNLGTQGVGDSSQVVVSGYITPRLQVKYGVGLFDGLAEFTLKYRLLPRLYFQSVSGVNQAFDLLYQFEF